MSIKTDVNKAKPLNATLNKSENINATLNGRRGDSVYYPTLIDKPQINDVTLVGNKSIEDLGVYTMTNIEIKEIFDRVFNKGE